MIVLVLTAVGTSVDAAAVGVTLAFLDANTLATFSLATLGMMIGRVVGDRFGAVVELLGGLALIGLGTKILLEHTGYIV